MYQLIGKLILTSTLVLAGLNSYAYKNDFALRAGFSYSQSSFNSLEDKDSINGQEIERDDSRSYGATTSYSYKWDRITAGVESRILLGNAADLAFNFENTTIRGEGSIRTVDITPFFQVNSKTFQIPGKLQEFFTGINISPWFAYFKAGPSWMLQTIDLDNFNVREELKEGHKLTYESVGFNITLGVEEDTPYKDMHPVFMEVSGSIYESYKVSLVDINDTRETNILASREAKQDIKTFSLVFTIGMTLY
jgi:hypothetical protein